LYHLNYYVLHPTFYLLAATSAITIASSGFANILRICKYFVHLQVFCAYASFSQKINKFVNFHSRHDSKFFHRRGRTSKNLHLLSIPQTIHRLGDTVSVHHHHTHYHEHLQRTKCIHFQLIWRTQYQKLPRNKETQLQ
jgi:hypothetical protein